VYLYGVPAYSTLGKLDDPLLSSFIRHPEAELARLLFHELAHQVVYAKDDSTFNESFAVSVERAGVQRWLAATGRTAQLQGIVEARESTAATMREFDLVRAQLKSLYGMPLAAEVMRSKKAELYAQLRTRIASNPRYAAIELSNAVLASFATYTQLVPAFEKILVEEGGDMEKFYARVKKLTPKGIRGYSPVPITGGAGDGSPVPATSQSSPGPLSGPSR
jgi:predicted aminopeptidase